MLTSNTENTHFFTVCIYAACMYVFWGHYFMENIEERGFTCLYVCLFLILDSPHSPALTFSALKTTDEFHYRIIGLQHSSLMKLGKEVKLF